MNVNGRETPEKGSRFSTPAPELDDHRDVVMLSPADAERGPASPARPVRKISISAHSHRQTPSVLEPPSRLEAFPRDLETAITDDDGDDTRSVRHGHDGSGSGPRRGFSKRVQQKLSNIVHSCDSTPSSSRSSSPPNSVDAFAEPRLRERGNTVGSRAGSELNIPITRTVSGGTTNRRPTFSSGAAKNEDVKQDSDRPEEDVCFPQSDEPTKTFSIDFEEMDEFVVENKRERPAGVCRRKHSFSSSGAAKLPIRPDGAAKAPTPATPKDSDSGLCDSFRGEKLDEKITGQDPVPAPEEVNRFSFFSSELEKTIHAPELGDLVTEDESFRDLFDLPAETGAWWLDVFCPTEAELEMFQKAFGIHRLTAEDIERQEPREKVELFQKYYFVCFRSFNHDKKSDDYLEPVNIYMVVFREGILTFSNAPSPHAHNVRKRIGKLRNYINLTADWICYALIDNIVDSFGAPIRAVEVQSDTIEDSVFTARTEDMPRLLREIGESRRTVMALMRLLGGKADVIKGFAKRCTEQYSVTPRGEIGLYLGDIQDHVVTMMSNLGHFEKMLGRCHSNYLAQLSVDNIAQGNRANKVLSQITLLATVLVPMNLVCGLFGMNVPVPGGVQPGPYYWFGGIVGFIALIAIAGVIFMRRLRYN